MLASLATAHAGASVDLAMHPRHGGLVGEADDGVGELELLGADSHWIGVHVCLILTLCLVTLAPHVFAAFGYT